MRCMIGSRGLFMMTSINVKEESGLKFAFPEKSTVIKFDDTHFTGSFLINCQNLKVWILYLLIKMK